MNFIFPRYLNVSKQTINIIKTFSTSFPKSLKEKKCRHELHFQRYILAIQYHGNYFTGVPRLGDEKKEIKNSKLYPSVEQSLYEALIQLVGKTNFEHMQISSRTDRGVHALWNTCHVDIRPNDWNTESLVKGLNYYIKQQFVYLRVIQALKAPISVPNRFYKSSTDQPLTLDWHARHNAYERTYLYRIIVSTTDPRVSEWYKPFEHDLYWRILIQSSKLESKLLNIEKMQKAANLMIGTHDFTHFRGSKCQRSSPMIYIKDIKIELENPFFITNGQQCITIKIVGNAFLYKQVRFMVGCLVDVGKSKSNSLTLSDVSKLLLLDTDQHTNLSRIQMAPPQGLYLMNVKHEYVSDPAFGINGPYDRTSDGRMIS